MTITKLIAAAAIAGMTVSAAFAQTAPATTPTAPKAPVVTTTPPPATTTTTTTAPKAGQKKASTPEGQACSAEADAKNLHGKDRVKFRSKCIKDMKAKAGTAAPKKS